MTDPVPPPDEPRSTRPLSLAVAIPILIVWLILLLLVAWLLLA